MHSHFNSKNVVQKPSHQNIGKKFTEEPTIFEEYLKKTAAKKKAGLSPKDSLEKGASLSK